MTTRIQVAPLTIRARVSKPEPDWVDLPDGMVTRPHNNPRPLAYTPPPPLNGNKSGEVWERYVVVPLTTPLTGLDQRIPLTMKKPDGTLTIKQHGYQAGTTSEEAWLDRLSHIEIPGPRGDNIISPYTTLRSSLMESPLGDLWTGISVSGFCYHILPDGTVVAICGFFCDPDTIPVSDASTSYWHGDFGGAGSPDGAPLITFRYPQDLWVREDPKDPDPISQHIYVADTGNNRIARVSHTDKTPTNPLGIKVRTFIDGLNDPVSLDIDVARGRMYITEKTGNRVVVVDLRAANPNSTKKTLASVPKGAFSLRLSSKGTCTVTEYRGERNLLDIHQDTGAVRIVRPLNNSQGTFNTTWLWHDCDKKGTNGPVDNCKVVQTGSYQHQLQIHLDGSPMSGATPYEQEKNAQFATHRQGTISMGQIPDTSDPMGHYPWAFSFSRFYDQGVYSGFGSTGIRIWRGRIPTDRWARADINTTIYNRGRGIFHDPGVGLPSFWPANGAHVWHMLGGGPTREDIIKLPVPDFNALIRQGFRAVVRRDVLTDAQCREARYSMYLNCPDSIRAGCKPTDMDAYVAGQASVTHTLAATVIGTSVTVTGDGTVSGTGTYPQGATATLVATPKAGSHFVAWGGDASGTNPTLAVVMDRAKTITATFAPNLPTE